MDKEEKRISEVVQYNNDFNRLSLKNFNAADMDLLMAICSAVKEQDTKKITLSFSEIRRLSNFSATSNNALYKAIRTTNEKLGKLFCDFGNENESVQFSLFPTFKTSKITGTLQVSVNEEYAYLLNALDKNFTRFELEEFTLLRSTYSKSLFRLLKQWRSVGEFRISVDRLRDLLDVPPSYTTGIMNRDIIKPAIKELNEYFKNLRYETQRDGRVISKYIFKFVPEKRFGNNFLQSDSVDEIPGQVSMFKEGKEENKITHDEIEKTMQRLKNML